MEASAGGRYGGINERGVPVSALPAGGEHPDRALHRQMNVFMGRLDEAPRRWYAALESQRVGQGGDRLLAQITGLDEQTIRRGRAELGAELVGRPAGRVRQVACARWGRAGRAPKKRSGDSPGAGRDRGAGDGGRPAERPEVGAL